MKAVSLSTRHLESTPKDLVVLIGPDHKLVWRGQVSFGVEVQLRTVRDNTLVAVIASGCAQISGELINLAMPYVREIMQYTISEDPI